MNTLFKMTRPVNVAIAMLSVCIATFILKQDIFVSTVLLSCLVVGGFTIFSNILNDVFDIPTDRINHPEQLLISKEISIINACVFACFCLWLIACFFRCFWLIVCFLERQIHIHI